MKSPAHAVAAGEGSRQNADPGACPHCPGGGVGMAMSQRNCRTHFAAQNGSETESGTSGHCLEGSEEPMKLPYPFCRAGEPAGRNWQLRAQDRVDAASRLTGGLGRRGPGLVPINTYKQICILWHLEIDDAQSSRAGLGPALSPVGGVVVEQLMRQSRAPPPTAGR